MFAWTYILYSSVPWYNEEEAYEKVTVNFQASFINLRQHSVILCNIMQIWLTINLKNII